MDSSPLIQEETEWGSGDRLEAARNFRAWVQVHVWRLRICSWPLNHQTRKLEGPSEINYPMLKTLHINYTNFLIFPPKSCHFPVYPPLAITASHLAAQARKPRHYWLIFFLPPSLPQFNAAPRLTDSTYLIATVKPIHFSRISTTSSFIQATNISPNNATTSTVHSDLYSTCS